MFFIFFFNLRILCDFFFEKRGEKIIQHDLLESRMCPHELHMWSHTFSQVSSFEIHVITFEVHVITRAIYMWFSSYFHEEFLHGIHLQREYLLLKIFFFVNFAQTHFAFLLINRLSFLVFIWLLHRLLFSLNIIPSLTETKQEIIALDNCSSIVVGPC